MNNSTLTFNSFRKDTHPAPISLCLGATIAFLFFGVLFGLFQWLGFPPNVSDRIASILMAIIFLALPATWVFFLAFRGRQSSRARRSSWVLPIAGLVFTPLSLILYTQLARSLRISHTVNFFENSNHAALILLGFSFIVLLVVGGIRNRSASLPLDSDWTGLVFFLFGSAQYSLWWTFQDYPVKILSFLNKGLYYALASLVLAAGAFMYMRLSRSQDRLVTLLGAALLAMLLAAAGKAFLMLGGGFEGVFTPSLAGALNEVKLTLISTAWLLAALASASVLQGLFSRKPASNVTVVSS